MIFTLVRIGCGCLPRRQVNDELREGVAVAGSFAFWDRHIPIMPQEGFLRFGKL